MIGIDIEEVERFKNLSDKIINRVYTKSEVEYCNSKANPEMHFAGMWCCKEAVVKCLHDLKFPVTEVEILHNPDGAPYVNPTAKIQKYLVEKNIKSIQVSISHTRTYATAIAMLEK